MSYNAKKKSFECILCGPGENRWKFSEAYYITNEETGDIYCLLHKDLKIGNLKDKENDN